MTYQIAEAQMNASRIGNMNRQHTPTYGPYLAVAMSAFFLAIGLYSAITGTTHILQLKRQLSISEYGVATVLDNERIHAGRRDGVVERDPLYRPTVALVDSFGERHVVQFEKMSARYSWNPGTQINVRYVVRADGDVAVAPAEFWTTWYDPIVTLMVGLMALLLSIGLWYMRYSPMLWKERTSRYNSD